MPKLIHVLLAGIFATSSPISVHLPELPPLIIEVHAQEVEPISTTTISEMIDAYAIKYHLNKDHFRKTIACESGFNPDIQSEYIDKNGKQEESYGLAQINLPSHPDISKAQALDPTFALEFMASNFADHASMWSCWRILFGK